MSCCIREQNKKVQIYRIKLLIKLGYKEQAFLDAYVKAYYEKLSRR